MRQTEPLSHQGGDWAASREHHVLASPVQMDGGLARPQGCWELETLQRHKHSRTQRVRSHTPGFMHPCKCFPFRSFFFFNVCLRRVITSLHFLPLPVAGARDILFRVADSVSVWGRQASGEWAPFRNFYRLGNIIRCFPAII